MKPSRRRIRRTKILAEVEGYIELGLAGHALAALGRLGDPTDFDPQSLYLWGEALRMLHRYDEAIVALRQAAKAAAENIHVWLALGWCYRRSDQLERAIDALEQALAVDPTEALLHYNLACYWSLAGGKRRALRYLSQALDLDCDYLQLIDDERDFDPIRFDAGFQALRDRGAAKE